MSSSSMRMKSFKNNMHVLAAMIASLLWILGDGYTLNWKVTMIHVCSEIIN